MGQLSNRLPTACGLALERGAGPSGLARGVAQKRRERRHRNQTCPLRSQLPHQVKELAWQ